MCEYHRKDALKSVPKKPMCQSSTWSNATSQFISREVEMEKLYCDVLYIFNPQ